MLDHVMLRVKDYAASKAFYDVVLGTLGYKRLMEFEGKYGGYGSDKPYFWIGEDAHPHPRTHIAFMAKDRPSVDRFHEAALKLGAKSDGAPGLRAQYHPNYYGAFVFDPDGHNIEAVCHAPEAPVRKGAVKAKAKTAKAKAAPRVTSTKSKSAAKGQARNRAKARTSRR